MIDCCYNAWNFRKFNWECNGLALVGEGRSINNSPLHYAPKAIQVTSLVPTLSFANTDIVKLLLVKFVIPQLDTALPTLDVFVPTQANTLVNGILNSTVVVLVCTNPHC